MKEVGDCNHLPVFQTLKCDEMLCKDLKRYFLTLVCCLKMGGGGGGGICFSLYNTGLFSETKSSTATAGFLISTPMHIMSRAS